MLMTVLLHDALAELPADDHRLWDKGGWATLLYADDTLLMGVSACAVQRFLEAVEIQGSKYGLDLHWDKVQLLQIRCNHLKQGSREHKTKGLHGVPLHYH